MVKIEPRALSTPERALIIRLLEHAGVARPSLTELGQLRVVETCDCGCGSIYLAPVGTEAPRQRATILADAYGAVQHGHAVGLILWGTSDTVSGLEIYSLAFDPPFELPIQCPTIIRASTQPSDERCMDAVHELMMRYFSLDAR